MPRVSTKKKNKGGKAESYRCDSCQEPIVAGQEYYEWSFRYGGTHRQHTTHGHPKQSQLTQSKMSGVYSAIESAEESLASAESIDDLKAALDDCKGSIEEVRDEYQESIDNMISPDGAVAQECQEKIDALESFMEELESTSDNLDEFDEDEPEEPEGELDAEAVKKWEGEKPLDEKSADYKAWEDRKPAAVKDPEAQEEWEKEHADWEETRDQHFEEKRSEASDVLGNLSI